MTDLQEANVAVEAGAESPRNESFDYDENGLFALLSSHILSRIIHTPALLADLVTAVSESTPEVDIERLVVNEVSDALDHKDLPDEELCREMVEEALSEKNLLETDDLDDKITDWFNEQSFDLSISL